MVWFELVGFGWIDRLWCGGWQPSLWSVLHIHIHIQSKHATHVPPQLAGAQGRQQPGVRLEVGWQPPLLHGADQRGVGLLRAVAEGGGAEEGVLLCVRVCVRVRVWCVMQGTC